MKMVSLFSPHLTNNLLKYLSIPVGLLRWPSIVSHTRSNDLSIVFVSNTLREIDPDTNCVVCISVSLGFPYMVSVFPCFLYMVSVLSCFPDMVMLTKHLNVKAIILDRALLWAVIDAVLSNGLWRRNEKPLLFNGTRTDLSEIPSAAIVDGQSIDSLLDFKVICYIFPWNNSIYKIGRSCRLGRVLGGIE